jgi:hypothetical protein
MPFHLRLTDPKSARNKEHLHEAPLNGGLASGDSSSSVNLEIALSGVAAKVKPPTSFSAESKCVEASNHVIKYDPSSLPTAVYGTLVLHVYELDTQSSTAARTML